MKNILFVAFLICINKINAQQPAFITDSLDAYIKREMVRWDIPALSIAIVKDGKIIVEKGYGVNDLSTKQATDQNTLFMVASNSKAFTGTGIALLEYQGRLSVNDKVTKHLPYFKMYDENLTNLVTIEDLLTHRMGFETFQGDFLNWGSNLSRKQLIQNIQYNAPVYDFRDTWGYCNAGYVTAGEIIYAVTDTTWDDFMKYHFFIPLEMNRTSTTYNAIQNDKNACTPYTLYENKLIKLNYDHLDNLAAVGGINSSAHDMANWLLLQLNNGTVNGKQVIPAEVVKSPRIPRSIVNAGGSGLYKSQHFNTYGLGWFLKDYEGRKLIMHDGGANGFVTSTCFIPEEQLGIVILTNTDANGLYDALRYQIIEAYFKLPYRNLSAIYKGFYQTGTDQTNNELAEFKKIVNKELKPALDLEAYTGTYKNSVYGTMEVKNENGNLICYFQHHPQLKGVLKPAGENEFICYYDPISWGVKKIPFTVESNKVTSATITINDFIDFMSYEFIKL